MNRGRLKRTNTSRTQTTTANARTRANTAASATKTKGRLRTQAKRTKITPASTRAEAFARTLEAAQVERTWYKQQPMMTANEITAAVRAGKLMRIVESNLISIARPSAENPLAGVQYAVLTPASSKLLNSIVNEFGARQARFKKKYFIRITSMTRDRQRQAELFRNSRYPAAKESTHGLGEAFDINAKWFMENSKAHFRLLQTLLGELHAQGAINLIDETAINGALHVARNPNYKPRPK